MSDCDFGEIIIKLWRDQFGYKSQICLRSNFDHYVHAPSKGEVIDHIEGRVDNHISIQRSVAIDLQPSDAYTQLVN